MLRHIDLACDCRDSRGVFLPDLARRQWRAFLRHTDGPLLARVRPVDNAHNEARTGRRLHGVADLAVQCIDRAASLHRSWSEPRPAEPVDPEVKRTGAYRPACGMALEGGPIR